MPERAVIDVRELPQHAFGPRAPVWWGNTLFLVIESMSMVILTVSYFYLRQNFGEWPPPSSYDVIPDLNPVPDYGPATINLLLLLASAPLAAWIHYGAQHERKTGVRVGMVVLVLLGIVSIGMRILEFRGLRVRWDENAYGSAVWGMLFTHLLYIIGSVGEAFATTLWILMHPWDMKHAVDVTLTVIYWNWMVLVGAIVYGIVFWSPRFT